MKFEIEDKSIPMVLVSLAHAATKYGECECDLCHTSFETICALIAKFDHRYEGKTAEETVDDILQRREIATTMKGTKARIKAFN